MTQVLELLKPPEEKTRRSGLLVENITKNRNTDIVPGNANYQCKGMLDVHIW